jgi:hypothetical protein
MSKEVKTTKTVKKNPLLETENLETEVEETTEEQSEEVEATEVEEETTVKPPVPKKEVKAPMDVQRELNSDIAMTKALLAKEPEVNFLVPLAEGEKPGAVHEVFINGYKMTVPKGVMTIVPKPVAELLGESYRINATAGAEFRLDLNADKQSNL